MNEVWIAVISGGIGSATTLFAKKEFLDFLKFLFTRQSQQIIKEQAKRIKALEAKKRKLEKLVGK